MGRKAILIAGCAFFLILTGLCASLSGWREACTADIAFCIDGAGGQEEIRAYQTTEDGYYVFLPSYADMAGVKLVNYGPFRLQIERNGKKQELDGTGACGALETDVSYRLRFLMGTGWEFYSIPLTFVKSEHLSTLYIQTESGSMEDVWADRSNRESGTAHLLNGDGGTDYQGAFSEIKMRGGTSIDFAKKPYQLTFSEDVSLCGMREGKTWILLANYRDDSKLKTKIATWLAEESGMPYTAQSEFVDLYLNGEYAGLYQLSERNEISANHIDVTSLEEKNEAVNEAGAIDEAERMVSEDGTKKWVELAAEPEDITGGYLFEVGSFHKKDSGFITDRDTWFGIRSPEACTKSEVEYLAGLLQETEDAIFAEDGNNPVTGKHYTEYIDLDSFAKKYIVLEITKSVEGWTTSDYFYKDSDSVDGRIYAASVWDFDLSFGDVSGMDGKFESAAGISQIAYQEEDSWYAALCRQPDFESRVKELYQEMFAPAMDELIDHRVEDLAETISASARMDDLRWDEWHVMDFQADVDNVWQWLVARKDALERCWYEGEEACTVTFHWSVEDYEGTYETVVMPGDRISDFPSVRPDYYRLLGWFDAESGARIHRFQTVTENLDLYAEWSYEPPDEEEEAAEGKKRLSVPSMAVPSVLLCICAGTLLVLEVRRWRQGGIRKRGRIR